MSFELFIGGRYLKSKQKHRFISFITVLSTAGVTVGVMALIIVIAVMSGAETYFKSKILGVEPHIIVRSHSGAIENYSEIDKRISRMKGIESVAPFVDTQVMLRAPNGISGAVVRGLDPAARGTEIMGMSRTAVSNDLTPGRVKNGTVSVPGIVLGKELAERLGVAKGNVLYVISPMGMMSPIGHMPSMKRFMVTGIFSSGFYEYDASLAYINLKDAQELLKIGDGVTAIGVRVKDLYQSGHLSSKISADLGFPYYTMDWMEMNRNFFSALKLEKEAMFVILILIILVAAFNIASTLIMMVMSKTRDIAILKTMGATDRSIRRIFVFKGMVIGFIGTGLGTALGVISSVLLKYYKFIKLPGDVYYFTTLPVRLEWTDILMIVAATMGICFLSTIYPALKASRLNPVEAIRYGSS